MNDYLMVILDEIIISVDERDKGWKESGQFPDKGGTGLCCVNATLTI
jgi:hypothetical protein